MDELLKTIAGVLIQYGGWGLLAIVLIQILFFGDKLLMTVEGFWKAVQNFSSFTFRHYTSAKLANQMLRAVQAVSCITDELLPYQVKVLWVKSEKVESFLKNGQIIVRIRDDEDINRSFVLAVMEFIRQGLIHNVKRHLRDEKLTNAIDMYAADKIVSAAGLESLSYFEKNLLNNLLVQDKIFANYFEQFKTIDRNGLFMPVFLNECSKALHCLNSQYVIEDYEQEVKDFLQYLINFCTQQHKRLRYTGKYIRISFGLIAGQSYVFRHGQETYVEKVRTAFSQGVQTVFLIGWGEKIKTVRQIALTAARNDLRVKAVRMHYYRHVFEDNSMIRAVCVELTTVRSSKPGDGC